MRAPYEMRLTVTIRSLGGASEVSVVKEASVTKAPAKDMMVELAKAAAAELVE